MASLNLLPAPAEPRYRTLDHWRGIACLLVVIFHATSVWERLVGSPDGPAGALLMLTRSAWIGVPIFFVISGYAISAAADAARRRDGGLRRYAGRRLRRIYPPYWAWLAIQALLMALIDVALWPGLISAGPRPLERPWLVEPAALFGNLTLTESWRWHLPPLAGEREYLLGQAWSLCYEEQFYLLVGLVLLVAARRLFPALALITAAVLALHAGSLAAGVAAPDGFFFDGYWLPFAAGALVYWVRNYRPGRPILLPLLLLGLLIDVGLTYPGLVGQQIVAGAGFAVVLLLLSRFDERLDALGGLRPLRRLGTICYAMYLSHAIVVRAISTALAEHGLAGSLATLLVVLPICLLAAIAVGGLFHLAVERHFLPRGGVGAPSVRPSVRGLD